MKRGLVFTLCALAAATLASTAMAQSTVDVSLNLRYNDPADPSDGGTWQLVAKTNDANGLALLNVQLTNAGTAAQANMASGIGAITTLPNLEDAIIDRAGGILEIVYSQDMTLANTVFGVGRSNFPGRIQNDPLRNATWNNATLIASGVFTTAAEPQFVNALPDDANTLPATVNGSTPAVAATIGLRTVRGDSLVTLGRETPAGAGLLAGDTDRNGTVNLGDLGTLAFNFNQAGGWDAGDTDGNGQVNLGDLGNLAFNFNQSSPAPAVGAIPEPATAGLAVLALLGVAAASRKRV